MSNGGGDVENEVENKGNIVSSLMSEEELQFHKDNRKYLRSKVTKICNFLSNSIDELDCETCIDELENAKSLKVKINDINDLVSKGLWIHEKDRTKLNQELDRCEKYDSDLTKIIRELNKKLRDLNAISNQAGGDMIFSNSNLVTPNQIKLPPLPLPEYSHSDGESLDNFFTNFENIVDKHNITQFEKFVLLTRQLKNEPLTLVKSLQGSNQSYAEAKALLIKAFSSPLTQKYELIDKLSRLKLSEENEPFSFISEMRIITQSFQSLQIDIDTVLQYFYWRAMPENLKLQLIHITNTNKPSLQQIEEKVFEAVERYQMSKKSNRTSSEAAYGYSAHAANVKYNDTKQPIKKQRPCVFCSEPNNPASHPIYKCDKYVNCKAKTDKLKSMKFCLKCATGTHKTSDCRFEFYKTCSACGGKHFSFLCMSTNKSEEEKTKKEVTKEEAKNLSLTVDYKLMSSYVNSSVILPTFTATFDKKKKVRVMRDSGAQASFICRSLAEEQQLKVVRKINLALSGFNSTVNYDTNVVNVPVWLGETKHNFEAICVPEINTKLKIPGLQKVAKQIIQKGYMLADEFHILGDEINDIRIIIGANALYCIPEKNVSFGFNGLYSETPIGLMLIGDVKVLSENLDYLPYIKNTNFCPFDNEIDVISANQVCINYCVTDEKGRLIESELRKATDSLLTESPVDLLNETCSSYLNCDTSDPNELTYDLDNKLVESTLNNTSRNNTGRLVMPLMWDEKISQFLGQNLNLSKQILKSNINKLKKNNERLMMVDNVIKEQIELGIISEIKNISEFVKEHEKCSFIGHMPIFKMDRDTTKCRVVYLSNICENSSSNHSVSHNVAIQSGPSLNRKISTAITLMRFNKHIFTYDIVKAFLAIELYPEDAERLCFLWVKDAQNNDFTTVAYKMNRLMFGLRCSPALLMLGLYKILVLDTETDDQKMKNLKKSMYDQLYMDNGCVGAENSEDLQWAYNNIKNIFSPYKIQLQQFVTNDPVLKRTFENFDAGNEQKLLGMMWNIKTDTISTRKLQLDKSANTKRKILKSIATNFDVLNFTCPVLNRSRLFMHSLQNQEDLHWDKIIDNDQLKVWHNICNQVNSTPCIAVDRYIGPRHDTYELHAFTDSSGVMFGVVIYLMNVNKRKTSFLIARNKIVGKKLMQKSIPSLEMHAILFGVETLYDNYIELTGETCVEPISISKLKLYTDSLVCLGWLQSFSYSKKMNKLNIFIRNRLNKVGNICDKITIQFNYCAGTMNPADMVTRMISHKQLIKTNFLTGIKYDELQALDDNDFPTVIIPNPQTTLDFSCCKAEIYNCEVKEKLFDLCRFSSFSKIIRILSHVLKFINNLKMRINKKNSYLHVLKSEPNFSQQALKFIFLQEQNVHFPELYKYFNLKNKLLKDIPPLISQLNIFKDECGILRVKSKMKRWKEQKSKREYPILMPKLGELLELLVCDVHRKLNHSGLYTTLKEIRKSYWIINGYSVVKRILRKCIHCRRFNNRPIKLSQSPYRDYRVSPSNIPFRQIFIDHLGYFLVKSNGSHTKVYILLFSCLWSRAVNLVVCRELSVPEFLRSFQSHVFKYGVPSLCLSDMGSSIVKGCQIMREIVNDEDVKSYFQEQNIGQTTEFYQYPKGCNKLGGMVESCVKMTKRLIYGSIKNNCLNVDDFYFLIERVNSLVNKRPIAFKSVIRTSDTNNEVPFPITPETLIFGREIPSLAIIPSLQEIDEESPWEIGDLDKHIKDSERKLSKANKLLINIYNEEFLTHLAVQATNQPERYIPIKHDSLDIGDIVLLKEQNCKPGNFPMGIVVGITRNCLQEVTEAEIKKGKTNMTVRRHVTSLIPLLKFSEYAAATDNMDEERDNQENTHNTDFDEIISLSKRESAIRCKEKIHKLYSEDAV